MKFDNTNISSLKSELLRLKSNPLDKTVTIGQLDAAQLTTVLDVLTSIAHIETIIFQANASVNDCLDFITAFIKKFEINYEFLHTDETQRMEILAYLYSAGLTDVIDDSDNKIRIKNATRTPVAHTLPPDNIPPVYKYAEEIKKQIPAPPPSPRKKDDDSIELLEENLSDNNLSDITSKRSQSDKHYQATKKHRSNLFPSIDPPHDTPITTLANLTHSRCGEAAKFHKAISSGNLEDVLLVFTKVPEDRQKKLLNEYCHEEFVDHPSVLKLALRSERFTLIASLITLGANPFQLSGNGYTLLHDIILDMQPEALRVFLTHVNPSKELSNYINIPFPNRVYDGYYALDIICLETTQYFNSYDEAIQIANQEDANSILEIVRQLLSHNAQSKLLKDANYDINSILNLDNILNFNFKDVWELVVIINSLHKIKQTQVAVETDHQSHSIKLLAQEWQKKGVPLPTHTAQPILDAQFESLNLLFANGEITQEEVDAQLGLLASFQTITPLRK